MFILAQSILELWVMSVSGAGVSFEMGGRRLELLTSCVSSRRSSQLS